MKRTITVLQDDIDNGQKREPNHCAIARAASRDLADLLGENGVAGIGSHLSLYLEAVLGRPASAASFYARLPAEAVAFLSDFDNSRPVQPFKFEVELQDNTEEGS